MTTWRTNFRNCTQRLVIVAAVHDRGKRAFAIELLDSSIAISLSSSSVKMGKVASCSSRYDAIFLYTYCTALCQRGCFELLHDWSDLQFCCRA